MGKMGPSKNYVYLAFFPAFYPNVFFQPSMLLATLNPTANLRLQGQQDHKAAKEKAACKFNLSPDRTKLEGENRRRIEDRAGNLNKLSQVLPESLDCRLIARSPTKICAVQEKIERVTRHKKVFVP